MMRLQRYKIKVVYKKGTTVYLADTSKAILPTTNVCKETNSEVFRVDLQGVPHTEGKLREATSSDATLSGLSKVIIKGVANLNVQHASNLDSILDVS